ncbi:nucleotide sugar dehydrogenase [Streptomyces sp. ME02-8801-2C]|uniref:nucleotide sugar dehydrogenase n=1 Tax=Streptomyces sp. ME02-8801-2C TaxID=3028680 RepID=UPI0029A0F87C|nr:nucleotide sugar dehydrogenase [Streptomyces sp. ME02-8801-2C]MDX3451814.1 nucleotide sugar dehydrogenase [Streptomyces sp. ME02-8801-2C]
MIDLAVIGLGYVGLPLARESAAVGLRVAGYDVNQRVVAGLNAGQSHVDDVSDADVRAMLAAGFTATAEASVLGTAQVVVICVPTPLHADGTPDLAPVRLATGTLAPHVGRGMLVVLESTTYPGTTDEVVRPILEQATGLTAGGDFNLAFSPERIDPGNKGFGLRNTPKVVGGLTPGCSQAAATFYGKVCDRVVLAKGTREAEMAKLLENTYRNVNIALVNELAMVAHDMDVDLWDAIACAATKPFGFESFRPGPGVGGHCIPVDPNYLIHQAHAASTAVRLVELAQEINRAMPDYVVRRAAEVLSGIGKPLKGATVLLAGVTYKADVSDLRETPARPIVRGLRAESADLVYHDPYVDRFTVDGEPVGRTTSIVRAAAAADLTILLQAHTSYDLDAIVAAAPLTLDARGCTRSGAELL